MSGKKVVAIDGPAGAGKSTVAKRVADRLNYLYIDTGAMYRAITLKAIKTGISIDDQQALANLAKNTKIKLTFDENRNLKVFLDDLDVTEDIRFPEVSQRVSEVASVPEVRVEMVRLQREMAVDQGTVMDGRDIASCVLPNANYKFFLTASSEVRALRRQKELMQKGYKVDLKQLESEIIERDRKDSEREMAPLKRVPEAILIDSSNLTIDQVVNLIVSHVMEGEN